MRGAIIGVLVALVLSVSLEVAVQLLVWGDNAPLWYLVVVLIFGMSCGYAGAWIGGSYDD